MQKRKWSHKVICSSAVNIFHYNNTNINAKREIVLYIEKGVCRWGGEKKAPSSSVVGSPQIQMKKSRKSKNKNEDKRHGLKHLAYNVEGCYLTQVL